MTVEYPPPGEQSQLRLEAVSVSRPVWEGLNRASVSGQVMAVFQRACLLQLPEGNLLALVLPSVGNGPLNTVVNGEPGIFQSLHPQTPARLAAGRLRAGAVEVSLEAVSVWEPIPHWHSLQAQIQIIRKRLPELRSTAQQLAPPDSLLALLSGEASIGSFDRASHSALLDATLDQALQGAQALVEGWAGDTDSVKIGATDLAGLGSGLTPAGDDFLSGAMLWVWLAHPAPERMSRTVLRAALPRTTIVSAAFLAAAARGECSAHWHNLFVTLSHGKGIEFTDVVQGVLSQGSTSGADTLAGFLWMGLHTGI